ncbi:MAG TPA: response regulator transcription factor [Candidatus Dormibacteraeota bacterium]|nr:response regulator transcription factor [Candidatus Dormibacteraeota bacterium]
MDESPLRLVLIADPDSRLRSEIREAFRQDGFEVAEAATGEETLAKFERRRPSVVLLEVDLPDMSGFDVCRELRRRGGLVPVILISSRSEEADVVVGLEIGADDYVTKPVRLRELTARVAANLRRARIDGPKSERVRMQFKDLLIDLNERRVVRQEQEITLTHTEFELLSLLAANAGKALSRERILKHIWGQDHPGDIETRVIDVHVRNLRRKIELEPSRPFYVLAVPGIGYRFTNARADS